MDDVKIREGYQIIANGLLKDMPDKEFTFLENYIVGINPYITAPSLANFNFEDTAILEVRTRHEGIWHQLRNQEARSMSEEEIIQYLDTISQENE